MPGPLQAIRDARTKRRDARTKRRAARGLRPVTSMADLEFARQHLDLRLKGRYGGWLLFLLAAQLVSADVLMFLYSAWGYGWKVPNTVMQAWLGATVVQLIGVVYVVVSHLFPGQLPGQPKPLPDAAAELPPAP